MDKRGLYRANDGRLAGVCGGVANYLGIDPTVARLLALCLFLLSGGLLAVVYGLFWLTLPHEPIGTKPLDVEPQEVVSDTYGRLPKTKASRSYGGTASFPRPSQPASERRKQAAEVRYDYQAGIAHVPPVPPRKKGVSGETGPLER